MIAELLKVGLPHAGFTDVTTHNHLDVINRSARRATRLDIPHLEEARRRSRAITNKRNQGDDRDHADAQRKRHVTQQRFEARSDRLIRSALCGTLAHRGATLTNPASIPNLLDSNRLPHRSLLLSTL